MDYFSSHDSLRTTLEEVGRREGAGDPSSSTNPSKKGVTDAYQSQNASPMPQTPFKETPPVAHKTPSSVPQRYADLFRLKEQARR
jgi:hypothetical protein